MSIREQQNVEVLVCYPISNFKFPVSASDFQSQYSAFNPILLTTHQEKFMVYYWDANALYPLPANSYGIELNDENRQQIF